MKDNCGIYKITSPSGAIYIGQSIDISRRFRNYKRKKIKGQLKLRSSLKKYGWKKHEFEIIRICHPKKLNKLEKYYIGLYKSNKAGLNSSNGGGKHYKHSSVFNKKSTSITLSEQTIKIVNVLCSTHQLSPSFSTMVEHLIKTNPKYIEQINKL